LEPRVSRIISILITVAILIFIGVTIYRPAKIFGVNDKQLESSVARSIGDAERVKRTETTCHEGSGGAWACSAFDRNSSQEDTYQLHVDGDGCWDGKLTTGGGGTGALPATLSACLSLNDYFRL
jgi:hypothetical protein